MTATAIPHPARSLLLPVVVLAGLMGLIATQLELPLSPPASSASVAAPQTVVVAARELHFRPAGAYQREGVPIDAPVQTLPATRSVEIMKYQVSAADYARCVAEQACPAAQPRRRSEGDVPVTGVSYNDAVAYAEWLSAATGQTWRLPSEAEWVQAAGSRFVDDALGYETDAGNPAERWLANYEREAALGGGTVAELLPLGGFGENEYGIADMAGSVWEWTSTCDGRTRLDAEGNVLSVLESCGVRMLQGKHRAGMSTFVRDGRAGGCTVGVPPDNLGFRLVRETGWQLPFGITLPF